MTSTQVPDRKIRARGLVQTFQTRQGRTKSEVRAVDGVDLHVAEGEVVAFSDPTGPARPPPCGC
jgi:ABC-2 type transport system ATP-binding protein